MHQTGTWSRVADRAQTLLDRAGLEPVGRLRREQQVVDAQALVGPPGAPLIVPPAVGLGARLADPIGVVQAEMQQRAQPRPLVRMIADRAFEQGRVEDVERVGATL